MKSKTIVERVVEKAKGIGCPVKITDLADHGPKAASRAKGGLPLEYFNVSLEAETDHSSQLEDLIRESVLDQLSGLGCQEMNKNVYWTGVFDGQIFKAYFFCENNQGLVIVESLPLSERV